MVIKVPKSENVQLRGGDEVVISELPCRACPVKLLKKYLTKISKHTKINTSNLKNDPILHYSYSMQKKAQKHT